MGCLRTSARYAVFLVFCDSYLAFLQFGQIVRYALLTPQRRGTSFFEQCARHAERKWGESWVWVRVVPDNRSRYGASSNRDETVVDTSRSIGRSARHEWGTVRDETGCREIA
jgi:hypothetical protein